MNTYVELREKIKNRDVYFYAFNELRKRSNRRGFFYSVLGCSVGMTLVVLSLQDASHSIFKITSASIFFLFFMHFLGNTVIGIDAKKNKHIFYNPFDCFNVYNSAYFLSGQFWKKEKKLSFFNSYKDALDFFEDCQSLDESSVVSFLKSVYEFSLEETDLFKECLVYREELGYWPKILLKMGAEIDKAKLNVFKLEICSLEGLGLNIKVKELENIAKSKIEVETESKSKSRVTSAY